MTGDKWQIDNIVGDKTVERKFQFHRRLAFKPHLLPQVDQRGDGIEQASRRWKSAAN